MEQQPPASPSLPSSPEPPLGLSYRRAETAADAPDNCYRCGYPLLSIDNEQACPECGLLARRSRRTTDELHNTRPRWLRRISRGANFILLAIVVAVAWPFAWELLLRRTYRSLLFSLPYWAWNYLPLLGAVAGSVLLVAGALLLTSAEGYAPADRADRRRRTALRLAATVPLLAMAALSAQILLGPRALGFGGAADRWWGLLDTVGWTLFTLACVPLPLLLFLQLRGLAKRARSAHLAEHCMIVGVGMSATILYIAAMGVVLDNAQRWGLGTNWIGRSTVALVLILVCSVAGALFTLWSAYLLIRFALAFRRAARALRGKWQDDDRSVAPTAGHQSPAGH